MIEKILIIGCGSIGIRHIRALRSIGEKNIYALRTYAGQTKELPLDIKSYVHEIKEKESAFRLEPSHVIISNPTSLHLEYIKEFINYGVKIFVEKPISDNFDDLEKLDSCQLKKIKENEGMVGFNLRFHTVFQFIKQIVKKKKLGRPIYANIEVGHYLPYWHSNEDYRIGYAARNDLGGGALRTLAHEIDLVQFIFGGIKTVFSKVEKLSNLQIDVDDCVDIIFTTESCKRVKVHLDYLWPLQKRRGEILFENGLIEYDYFEGKIYQTLYKYRKRVLCYEVPSEYSYDRQYQAQMKDFLSSKSSSIGCNLSLGIENLRIIDLCEKSQKNGQIQYVQDR